MRQKLQVWYCRISSANAHLKKEIIVVVVQAMKSVEDLGKN